jgi:peptidoglycan hydrolase-like protein with peptidoglycan-binding domain
MAPGREAISSNLRIGSAGMSVKRIQDALNLQMLPPHNIITKPALKPLVPDGKFGPKTDAMVREFQGLNRIQIDGVVGAGHAAPSVSIRQHRSVY